MKELRNWLFALFWALLIVSLVQFLLFKVNVIPSSSMHPSMIEGDYVVVNKWRYGARMPFTPLAIPLVHNKMPFSEKPSYSTKVEWKYRRLPGFGGIQRNDIIVFNYPLVETPIDRRDHFVKRVAALAGDTLQIVNGKVLVNGAYTQEHIPLQFDYNLVVKEGKRLDRAWMREWEITEGGQRTLDGYYRFALTPEKADSISKQPYVKAIERAVLDKGIVTENDLVFPRKADKYPWNSDNFGPLVIPNKGKTVALNKSNLPFYQRIIQVYEGHELLVEGEEIKIDSQLVESYTFAQDYYFVMGDNRHDSVDSRYWGFVPEDHIVGKAGFVGFSVQPHLKWFHKGAIRWERLFMGLK